MKFPIWLIPIFIIAILLPLMNKEQNSGDKLNKKVLMIVLGLLFLLGIFIFFNFILNKKDGVVITKPEIEVVIEKEEQVIGGDKDEGECLIGAGYSWCGAKQKCLREWEESCDSGEIDKELIK